MKTLLLHLGYPKTGTTSLQASLFPKAGGWDFLGKTHEETMPESLDAFRTLVNYGTEYHVQTAGPTVLEGIRKTAAEGRDDIALISLEGLTNPFVDTHYTQPKDIYRKATDIRRILAPLLDEGVTVKVLATLRVQTELLPSLFSQCFLQGFSSGLFKPNYVSFLDFMFDDRLLGFGPDFQFDAFLDHCGELFGVENTFATAMDGLFSGTPCRDTAVMAAFLGLPETDCIELMGTKKLNIRKADKDRRRMMVRSPGVDRFERNTGVSLKRRVFTFADRLRIHRGQPVFQSLSDQSARIVDYYGASNTRLAEHYGIRV